MRDRPPSRPPGLFEFIAEKEKIPTFAERAPGHETVRWILILNWSARGFRVWPAISTLKDAMRPLGGRNTIWLCEAEKRSRNPDFAGLKTWPGGKAKPAEG